MITKCRPNKAIIILVPERSLERFARVLGTMKKAMGQCTAQCKMLLFRARVIIRDLDCTELAHLKKEIKTFHLFGEFLVWYFGEFLVWYFLQCFLVPLGVLLVMKTLDDEWYVVIKAYKLTIFGILRNVFVLSYIVY